MNSYHLQGGMGDNHMTTAVKKHRWTNAEHELVRLHYDGHAASVRQIASTLDVTFYAVKGRVGVLGLAREKPAEWSPEEIARLEQMLPRYSVQYIARRLGRSANGIAVKIKRLHLSRRVRDGWYTKNEASEILGVDPKTVQCWINRGELRASWHHGHKPSQVGSASWHIERKDLAGFIRCHARELTGRNIDLFCLLEVLGQIPLKQEN
jgi:hypothetical protein